MKLDTQRREHPRSPSKKVLHHNHKDHGPGRKRHRTELRDAKTGGEQQDRKHQTTTTTTTATNGTATTVAATSEKPGKLSREQLMKISQEVIEHTKQLGLFDEVRMKLLSRMEARPEYQRVEQHFDREVETFCKHEADLTKSRAELRKQLIDRLGPSETRRRTTTLSASLDKNISYIVQKYERDLLRKCSETAREYLLAKGYTDKVID